MMDEFNREKEMEKREKESKTRTIYGPLIPRKEESVIDQISFSMTPFSFSVILPLKVLLNPLSF